MKYVRVASKMQSIEIRDGDQVFVDFQVRFGYEQFDPESCLTSLS